MILVLSLLCLPSRGACEMAAMSDNELSQVTGHGFSDFTLTLASDPSEYDIARVDLNLQASTYATMDSLKLGYWDNTGAGNLGWDQNWLGVSVGSITEDMVLSQFFLQAEFTNINDEATRQLKTIELGFQQAYGTLNADFASLSQGVLSREAAGAATYTFDGDPLVLRISVDEANPGIWFDFGSATRSE
jgi:hypothetical protein